MYVNNCNCFTFAGILVDSKASKKEKCWSDYKAQLLYIDAMREAKEDPEFDPRRSHLVTGKDGRFEKISKAVVPIPKNPLTVQYLCHAYGVPYPTFKRWKQDAFHTKGCVPIHKGKTVLTCPKLAAQVYNAGRMYCDHHMAVWLQKYPHRKYDSIGKKVLVKCLNVIGNASTTIFEMSFIFS
jgi:hypothetical protein